MFLVSGLKKVAINSLDKITQKISKKNEIKKFKDPKRVEIFETVQLSKEQMQQIDDFYLTNYGKKIPYTWHRHFTAFTGNFDVKYIPELLFIPEFERYMNVNREYTKTFEDKSVLPLIAQSVGVKVPKSYISVCEGAYRDSNFRVITKEAAIKILCDLGECFAKPTVETGSGVGCKVLNLQNGVDIVSHTPLSDVLDSFGSNFIIQERLHCHKSISDIYSGSVNTFRIITYRWKDQFYTMPIIMRIGSGGHYLDNAHAGGMFIAVSEDGKLHRTAFTEFKKEFEKHPDTGLVFDGYQIECFDDVVKAALKMHEAIPQVGVINWDFTIDSNGEPILIEANMNGGSIWLMEMAHGCGVFGDLAEEVLQWLRFVNTLPMTERKKYSFGKMENC